MKEIRNIAMASLAALALLSASNDNIYAQVRRSTTTTQNRSTSGGSSSQTRSSSSQSRSSATSQTRSSSSQARSSAASQTRSSSTSFQQRSTGTQTRQSGSSSQVRQSGSSSQVRQSGSTSQTRQSSSSSSSQQRSTGTQTRQSGTSSQVRQSGSSSQVRQSGSSTQTRQNTATDNRRTSSSSATRTSSGSDHRVAQPVGGSSSSSQSRQSSSSSAVRSNTNVTRSGLGTVTSQMRSQSGSNYRTPSSGRPGSRMDNSSDFRIEDHNVQRVPPRDRDFMPYDRPGHFYDRHDPHCFGFRVEMLPPRHKVVRYFGIDYYIYNDVYYRPYGGHYIVCRPPFGVTIARSVSDLAFAAVNFAFYSNVYRTYSAIDANNRYIDQQNRIIAQNNATIMAQNNYIAMNPNSAMSSYEIANRLGLVQSYAYADRNYFYEDGVFYIINANGQYQVIVPPAGALVQNLPEDYDTITLGGVQYYRVDDTVYRLTLVSGAPYLEVLGQMYGQMARNYGYGY